MRIVFGFLTTLFYSIVAIVLLFSLSPVFMTVQALLEPETSILYTPAAKSLVDFAMTKGWVTLVLFIVINSVILWGLQIFRKEELEEEQEFEYWR